MAGDAMWGRVTARLRRAVCGRALRRVLVIVGLAAAGWLVGGAAQASADEAPPAPGGQVVPVLNAVRAGAAEATKVASAPAVAKVPRVVEQLGEGTAPKIVPPRIDPGEAVGKIATPPPSSSGHRSDSGVSWIRTRSTERAPDRAEGRTVRKAAVGERVVPRGSAKKADRAHGKRTVRRPVSKVPAPPSQGGNAGSVAGPVVFGGVGGLPSRQAWEPVRHASVLLRASSALPPAVRTAADEPTFAPD
ncbi:MULTISPECIES: hypothetical protein [Actinomadura]|uniref:Secreted protein n=1 Tax=Actinomadura yumaensis TaxID=111807 RepID=A0ABW2CD07_9ACTN|nr:hypothetical protein [Actinomadura sp. J1-007]MWK35672.1 hypothetical protein [Actinomadura sp. J1-007]